MAFLDDYKVASIQCYGYADRDNKRPITSKTIFQVGSISKPVSAWGILLLAEKGKVNLDQPVDGIRQCGIYPIPSLIKTM